MSVSDDLMWRYYDLLSFKPTEEINALREQAKQGANPRDIKVALAKEIITRFHSEKDADTAYEHFVSQFKKNEIPEDIPEFEFKVGKEGLAIANLLKDAKLTPSTTDALRMIEQGGVRIDGDRIGDKKLVINSGTECIYQVGKRRFAKVKLT